VVRSLTSTLQAAVNSQTRVPTVSLTLEDHVQHFGNFLSAVNPDGYHDACLANDGSIVRVQLTRGGTGFDRNFQYQRITNPNTGSQWTTWTTFAGASGTMFQDGDCCISNNSGTLRAFAMHAITGTTQIWTWSSTDNGQTWSSSLTVVAALPSAALIKGIGSGGNNDVFYLYDITNGETIGYNLFSSGTWGTAFTWPYGLAGSYGTGLTVAYDGQYHIVWSDGYALYLAVMTIGGSWTQLTPIAPAASTAVNRLAPRLKLDSSLNLWNLTCIEYDPGTITGVTYQYPRIRQSSDLEHWSSGFIVHDISSALYGAYTLQLSSFNTVGATFLITQPTIQLASNFSQSVSANYLDLSNALLSYQRSEHLGQPGKIELLIDNANGAFNGAVGTNTSYQPIGSNVTLVLKEGYKTGSPPTTVERLTTARYHLNKFQFLRSPQENLLKLTAYDLTRNLDIVNRFQNTYTSKTVSWLLTEICARAGLFHLVIPGTSQVSNTVDLFVLQSGQTYRQVLDELCNTYYLEYFMDENETLIFVELQNSDPVRWSYQNEILLLTYSNNDLRGNHVIVTGKPKTGSGSIGVMTTGEAYDDVNAHLVGLERVVHHIDPKLTTVAQCQSKAGFLLLQEQRATYEHSLTVPYNPALQLLDVLNVTDAATPIGSSQPGNARILQSLITYNAQHATYEHVFDLEGV
jgi:hypothetical protein